MHELAVRLASVAHLVTALHHNRQAAGSIPAGGPSVAFFTIIPGQVLNCVCILQNSPNCGTGLIFCSTTTPSFICKHSHFLLSCLFIVVYLHLCQKHSVFKAFYQH